MAIKHEVISLEQAMLETMPEPIVEPTTLAKEVGPAELPDPVCARSLRKIIGHISDSEVFAMSGTTAAACNAYTNYAPSSESLWRVSGLRKAC